MTDKKSPTTLVVEVPEAEIRAAVAAEVSRKVRDRLAYNADFFRETADAKIREVALGLLAETDIDALVRKEIDAVFERFLADGVRHQVRSVVRLAVQKELAVQRAAIEDPPAAEPASAGSLMERLCTRAVLAVSSGATSVQMTRAELREAITLKISPTDHLIASGLKIYGLSIEEVEVVTHA